MKEYNWNETNIITMGQEKKSLCTRMIFMSGMAITKQSKE